MSPPDAPSHASRDFAQTVRLAEREGLDFVILTPHIRAHFFERDSARARVTAAQRALEAEIARARTSTLFIPGFEYTDYEYGHVGIAFAEMADVLADVSAADARSDPTRFFSSWIAHGGVITINHPVLRPIPHAGFSPARANLSWRAFSGARVPAEINWLTRHAQNMEVYNLDVSHLRDQFALGDRDLSLREAAHLAETESRARGGHVAHVGGSDSHGDHLRPVTYLLAREKTASGVRAALLAGRTCVRAPEACTLQARSSSGAPWRNVGEALPRADGAIEARAAGGDVTFLVDGVKAAVGSANAVVRVPIPAWKRCAQVRAIVGDGWSSPIYVGACSEGARRTEERRGDGAR